MSDAVTVAAITGFFSFLAAVLSLWNARLTQWGNRKISTLEENTNGKMDALLGARQEVRETAVDAAYHRGILEGQRQERERCDKSSTSG